MWYWHHRAKELDQIGRLLNPVATITDIALQDLAHGVKNRQCVARGMSGEQVHEPLDIYESVKIWWDL